jgi:hypothetical protein
LGHADGKVIPLCFGGYEEVHNLIISLAGRAETRREWVRAEEERMKRDKDAQWLARVRGWAKVR